MRSRNLNRDKEPLFSISVVSRITGISPRVLRSYEEADLIRPYRTEGQTRLYSERDLQKLRMIYYLHKEKEVNLSGIKVILDVVSDRLKEAGTGDPKGEGPKSDVLLKIKEIAPELLEEADQPKGRDVKDTYKRTGLVKNNKK